jgi:hypothetical protein
VKGRTPDDLWTGFEVLVGRAFGHKQTPTRPYPASSKVLLKRPPATVKLSSAGASLEVPLGHKDDLWSFDHIDTMTLCIADAPRPDEIVMAVAFADAARINARVPKL